MKFIVAILFSALLALTSAQVGYNKLRVTY